ncbi:hypothetical protein [Sphingomonas sanguinis]|nr:hypothetical protein [Sphingomonas sanguinis]
MPMPHPARVLSTRPLRWLAIFGAPWLIAASTPRYDWSSADISYLKDSPYFAEAAPSRALCRRLIDREPAPSERPDRAQTAALRDCDSEALLYGIGRPADPVAARRCAILERDDEVDTPNAYFSGSGILAVAYANGWGGARDIDRAIHMACGIDDAASATEDRIEHLQALAGKPVAKPFAICDDISSGASGGVCAAHHAKLREQDRQRLMAGWQRNWPAPRRAAFARTYASMTAYAETAHDLDCYGGTAAAQCAIDGTQADLDRFVAKIGALLGRNPPPPVSRVERRINAATATDRWQKQLAEMDDRTRPAFIENGRRTIAARARFERDLLAFAATIPGVTSHQARRSFADL